MQTDLEGRVPQIVVDIHETGGKRVNATKHLMSMLDKEKIPYTVQQIPIGDILGMDGVAIERKTTSDLVNTLRGSNIGVPRLNKQLDGLMKYEKPCLLVEDILSIRRDPSKGCVYIPFKTRQTRGRPYVVTMERVSFIHPNALDALIESIRERGIKVIEGFNALHSAGLLFGLLTGPSEKPEDEHSRRLPVIRTRKGLDSMDDEQEFFIAGLPGINVVRAKSLLNAFGSPIEVVTRTDEWTRVPGIGPKTVASAKKMLFSVHTGRSEDEKGGDKSDQSSQPDLS
jgi:ERCC4-type nuclease